MNAKQILAEGDSWTADRARLTLRILLRLATSGRTLSYGELDQAIAREFGRAPNPIVAGYGRVLEIVGQSLNALSDEWGTEVPPLTILVVNRETGEPGVGFDGFLQRYVSRGSAQTVTPDNRRAMIARATEAVFNYGQWHEVAASYEVEPPGAGAEAEPIALEKPPARLGPESEAHQALKAYVAAHPELFAHIGLFTEGRQEVRLDSGDEVDVLFHNDEQTLAVEVKTADAPGGELTRGLYQCVKYRAVLRAMVHVRGELVNVRALLVVARPLPERHQRAAERLAVPWQRVEVKR